MKVQGDAWDSFTLLSKAESSSLPQDSCGACLSPAHLFLQLFVFGRKRDEGFPVLEKMEV